MYEAALLGTLTSLERIPVAIEIRVDWGPGSPFLDMILGRIAAEARRWKARDPLEALPEVWSGLRVHYPEGRLIDPGDGRLRMIVRRRASKYFSRSRGIEPALKESVSLDKRIDEDGLEARSPTPDLDLSHRELLDFLGVELARLGVRRREAVLCKLGLGRVGTAADLARSWGTSPQYVHQQAKKGLE